MLRLSTKTPQNMVPARCSPVRPSRSRREQERQEREPVIRTTKTTSSKRVQPLHAWRLLWPRISILRRQFAPGMAKKIAAIGQSDITKWILDRLTIFLSDEITSHHRVLGHSIFQRSLS